LEGILQLQEISCNGKQLRYSRRKFFEGYTLVAIKVPRFLRSELTVRLSFRFNLFEKVVEVSPNHPPVRGNGKNPLTLVTVQKDNPLQLIKDWMHWHNRMHGVGQLILYDNGSREYGNDELLGTLHEEEEDFRSVLFNWDFPYTWDGWDGRRAIWFPWPQRAALNHYYLKFGDCGWLLNLDIDEYLVAAEDTTPLRDYLRQTPEHYLPFRSREMLQIGPEKPLAKRSFRDFLWRSSTSHKPECKLVLASGEYPYHYWKYACQCNIPLWLDAHRVVHQGIRRYRFKLQIKLYSLIRRMGLIELFGMDNNDSPREVFRGEMFWVYHFMSLNVMWGPHHKKKRMSYRDKAYFDLKGAEVIYDDTMLK